ncbi:MAG: 3-oxoacyl-[acyl-carrier-protein] reductase [SAR202 cluster bacterium]|nr:3-oxoacyl-[acyl-carrier-protein] reductase [SAR202 cluster bacterium]
MSLELEDKIALVTGSSKGLGKAIAIRLAEKGARVAVNYNTSPDSAAEVVKAIADAGGSAIAVKADVANLDQVVAMVKQVEEELGAVEILVNNAGIINDQLLMRMSDEAWRQVIDINLNGTFYCTRAVLRNMVRARWGRIINIGSVVGLRGNPAQTNYSASKAAIMGFTKALAKEVANRNITANVVTPGYFETETTAILTDEQKAYWLNAIPQGHFGEVDDVAHMVTYLADEKAKYITGQVISVDGGMAV